MPLAMVLIVGQFRYSHAVYTLRVSILRLRTSSSVVYVHSISPSNRMQSNSDDTYAFYTSMILSACVGRLLRLRMALIAITN
jgi:hypothetical protein